MTTRLNRELKADFKAARKDNIVLVRRITKHEAFQTVGGSVVGIPGDVALYNEHYQLISVIDEKEFAQSFVQITENDLPI